MAYSVKSKKNAQRFLDREPSPTPFIKPTKSSTTSTKSSDESVDYDNDSEGSYSGIFDFEHDDKSSDTNKLFDAEEIFFPLTKINK